ncbi:MAG TPA: hypothetical protein VGE39_00780 [Prosthecobacter sp.]
MKGIINSTSNMAGFSLDSLTRMSQEVKDTDKIRGIKTEKGVFSKEGVCLYSSSNKPGKNMEKREIKQSNAKTYVAEGLKNTLKSFPLEKQQRLQEGFGNIIQQVRTFSGEMTGLQLKNLVKNVDSLLRKDIIAEQMELQSFRNSRLDGMATMNVQWSVSSSGAGGVIFAKDTKNNKDLVLKFDPPSKMEATEKFYNVANDLQGSGCILPFKLPKYGKLELKPNELIQVKYKLEQCHEEAKISFEKKGDEGSKRSMLKTSSGPYNLQTGEGQYHNLLEQSGGVGKFEKLTGFSCTTDLSLEKRLDLFKSPEFAKSLGKTMVVSTMLGLNDHVGLGKGFGTVNFSNVMINDQKEIAIIDLETTAHMHNQNPMQGLSPAQLQKGLNTMLDFLMQITKSENTLAEELITETKKGLNANQFGTQTTNSPLECLMIAMCKGKDMTTGYFFDSKDNHAEKLKGGDFMRFTNGVTQGMLEGLNFVVENRDSFALSLEKNGFATGMKSVLNEFALRLEKFDSEGAMKLLASHWENQSN